MSFEVMLQQLAAGFGQTCAIFALTLIFSLPLGLLVYFGRNTKVKPISWLVKIYISIMRGTPLMLQLLIWYFGPYYLWGMNIGAVSYTHLGGDPGESGMFSEDHRVAGFPGGL